MSIVNGTFAGLRHHLALHLTLSLLEVCVCLEDVVSMFLLLGEDLEEGVDSS